MQLQLDKFSVLEERVYQVIERIQDLKSDKTRLSEEKTRLEEEKNRLLENQQILERRIEALEEEKRELLLEGQGFRAKEEQWTQYEKDREEMRVRIDQMLEKFEELEI